MFILNVTGLCERYVWNNFSRFVVLAYSLPVWAYYLVQLRSAKLLLGWLMLLAGNVVMFRFGASIDSGRVRRSTLVLYGTLFISLILLGLYGLLQLF